MGKYDELESVLKKWMAQVRSEPNPIPLDGPLITEKALEIAKKMNIDGFTASNGWLHRFKLRDGIRWRQISGEAKDEKCIGGKLSKERLTILACANADGSEKLPLLVIGKSKKPRCFKHVKTLPAACKYDAQRKAYYKLYPASRSRCH